LNIHKVVLNIHKVVGVGLFALLFFVIFLL